MRWDTVFDIKRQRCLVGQFGLEDRVMSYRVEGREGSRTNWTQGSIMAVGKE